LRGNLYIQTRCQADNAQQREKEKVMFTVENIARYTLVDFRAARKEMRVDSDEFRKFISDLEGKNADDVAYEFSDFDVVIVYDAYHVYLPHNKETQKYEVGGGIDESYDSLDDAEKALFAMTHCNLLARYKVVEH
jgi:hypothetical protein